MPRSRQKRVKNRLISRDNTRKSRDFVTRVKQQLPAVAHSSPHHSPPHTPKTTPSGPLLTTTTATTRTRAPGRDDAKGRGREHDDKEGRVFFSLIYYIQLLTPSPSHSCPVPQLKHEKGASRARFSPQDASASSGTQQHERGRWVRDESARGTQRRGWGWARCAHLHKRFVLFFLTCYLPY